METHYSVHDVVRFKIVEKTGFLKRYLSGTEIQYKNFEADRSDDLDFVVRLGEFTPRNTDCIVLDDKYYIKRDYIFCEEDSYKLAKWKFEISGFESGNMRVSVSSNLSGSFFVSGFIIDSLLRFKLETMGYSVVHASCVSKDGRAIALSSQSGGGKTRIALHLVENEYDFLGDNFLIIKNGRALSFLSPLNVFTYNLSPSIKSSFGFRQNMVLHLKDLVFRASSSRVKIFTKVNPKSVFSQAIVDESELRCVIVLNPRKDFSTKKISKRELVDRLVNNQKSEFVPFSKYMLEYSYKFDEGIFSDFWHICEENLIKNLPDNLRMLEVEVPPLYDGALLNNILEVIEAGI